MAGSKELKLAISIGAKIDKTLGSTINNVQSQLGKIGNIANKIGMATTAAVAAGATKIIHDSVQAYTEYESALNSAAATAGIEKGSAAYEQMNAAARQAGATTVKTAKESAEALEYMALAGWSVEDSTKALMPVLKLSAAANMDLATTSDLVTDTMAAMGLGINDLGRYLDVLTKGNNSANYKAQELLESYTGVGSVLRNLNVPIEKSAAILGVMADQSLKGSEAGTALNAILVNMQKKSGDSYKAMSKLGVSMYDSAGNARDLLQVFQDVHDKTASMTEEQRNLMYQMIGGKAHVADFGLIMNGFAKSAETGTARVYDLEKAYNGAQGTLDKFYDIKTSTLEASIVTLNSAYESMLIDIGGQLAPTVSNAVNNLVDKMPQIENAIMSFLNTIIPAGAKAIDLLTRNPDKVINAVTGIVKAFLLFKGIKGLAIIATLAKDLKTLTSAASGLSVLKGAAGALTGLGTGATAALGAVGALVAPIAAVAAAAGIGVVAYKAWDKARNHWADNLAGLEKPIEQHANSIERVNSLSSELGELQLIINSPNSSAEQITTAQTRLQGIADLLKQEYGLHINVDNTGLSEAAEQVHEIINALSYKEHVDLAESTVKYIDELTGLTPQYKEAVAGIPEKMSTYKQAATANTAINGSGGAWSNLQFATTNFDLTGDLSKYADRARSAVQQILDAGLTTEFAEAGFNYGLTAIDGMADALKTGNASKLMLNESEIEKVRQTMNDLANDTTAAFNQANSELEEARGNIAEFDRVSNKAAEDLAKALRSDVLLGNIEQAENVTNQFRQLGETIAAAGASTDTLAQNFALANSGFADMKAAIEGGGIQKVATDFLNFQLSIGQSAASAVQGAAVIANGFDSVEVAAAAGDAAVNAIIADMARLGAAQGMFNGLDNNGIAAKLSEMAHAINLIPEDKQITINADGGFSVIAAAAATLKDTPTEITVNATDNATQTLQNVQAETDALNTAEVAPEVAATDNASPVLNTIKGVLEAIGGMFTSTTVLAADEVTPVVSQVQGELAALDGKKSKTTIDVTDKASGKINLLKGVFATLSGKSASASLNATDNASSKITGVQGKLSALGGVRTAPTVSLNDQATSKISSIQRGLSTLPTSKTITVTTVYQSKGTPPGHSAAGTPSWRGGLTYLNDQPGISDPREVVEYKGQRYWFGGRNVLADVPQGARIYNAAQSRGMIDESEADDYRTGGGAFGRAIDRLRYTRSESGASSGGESGGMNVTYSPNIVIEGNADEAAISRALRSGYDDFTEYMDRYNREQRRKSFGVA